MRNLFAAALIALGAVGQSQAATLFFDDFSPQQAGWSSVSSPAGLLGPINQDGGGGFLGVSSVTLTLNVAAADPEGLLEFDLVAFQTLDDNNCCQDTLTVSVNGTDIAQAFFAGFRNHGEFISAPLGSELVDIGPVFPGVVNFVYRVSLPVALLAGSNTFTFSYSELQDPTDESWGLDNVRVSGIAAVPEPGTWALMAGGLAAAALFTRRRRSA